MMTVKELKELLLEFDETKSIFFAACDSLDAYKKEIHPLYECILGTENDWEQENNYNFFLLVERSESKPQIKEQSSIESVEKSKSNILNLN